MDIAGFITAILAVMTDPAGIVSAASQAVQTAGAGIDNAQLRFRQWMGRHLARPMRNFIWWCCAGLALIGILAGYLHFALLSPEARANGIFGRFVLVTLASIAGTAFFAWRHSHYVVGRQEDVDDEPLRISTFWCGGVLIAAVSLVSLTLSLHAVFTESRALWLVSMLTRYLALVVIAVAASMLSWFIRKGVGLFEKVLQAVVEPLAALLPGVTLQNVTRKLFGDGELNLIEEEYWGAKITAAASAVAIITIPFDLVVFIYPTGLTAICVGGAYIFALLAGKLLYMVGKYEIVDESRDRMLILLFNWGKWLMLAVLGGWAAVVAFIPDSIRHGLSGQSANSTSWLSELLHGQVPLVGNHSLLYIIPLLLVFFCLTAYFVQLARETDWPKWVKVLAIAVPALAVGFCVISLFSGDNGWTPFPRVEAKTTNQIMMINAPKQQDTETRMKLGWITDRPADCQLEIVDLRYKPGYEHEIYKKGSRVQAQAALLFPLIHSVTLNDLATGTVIRYRIYATHLEGAAKGMITVSETFERTFRPSQSEPKADDDSSKPSVRKTDGVEAASPRPTPRVGVRPSRPLARRDVPCSKSYQESRQQVIELARELGVE